MKRHYHQHSEISVERAAAYLDAIKVGEAWRYYAHETDEWYEVDECALVALGEALGANEPEAYSLWCAAYSAERVDGPYPADI